MFFAERGKKRPERPSPDRGAAGDRQLRGAARERGLLHLVPGAGWVGGEVFKRPVFMGRALGSAFHRSVWVFMLVWMGLDSPLQLLAG